MRHTIPPEREAALALVAETSKREKVVVACRSRVVRRQYERAVVKRGGKLENVVFHILCDAFPEEVPHA